MGCLPLSDNKTLLLFFPHEFFSWNVFRKSGFSSQLLSRHLQPTCRYYMKIGEGGTLRLGAHLLNRNDYLWTTAQPWSCCVYLKPVLFSPFFYVEHRAFMKLFHLVLSKASLYASFQLIPNFWSSPSIVLFQDVLAVPLFLVPWRFQSNACRPIALCGLRNVGQSNAIFFPLFVVRWVFVLFSATMPHLKFCPATWRLNYVLGTGLQALAVNYLSVQLFSTFHTRTIGLT